MNSRTEALSMVVHRKVAFDQLAEHFVRSVGVDTSNQDIVVTMTDGSIKRIPRRASGISQNDVVMVSNAGYNQDGFLQVNLSNGQIFVLAKQKNPIDYRGYSGSGIYLGVVDGIHVFKPIVSATDDPMVGATLPIQMGPGIPRDWSNYLEVLYESGNDNSAPANTWVFRRTVAKVNNIAGATVGTYSIRLPAGRYYVESDVLQFRGGTSKSALFKQTPVGDSPTTNVRLSETNPGYGWENTGSLQAEQSHILRTLVDLQDATNQIAIGTINSSATSYATWVWTGHVTRIWKLS